MSSKYNHQVLSTSLNKCKQRQHLYNAFHIITGKRKLPKNWNYITLCSRQVKSPRSEVGLLSNNIKMIKESQYIGVDLNKNHIKQNKKSYPEAHFLPGDMSELFETGIFKEIGKSVVHYDSCNVSTNKENLWKKVKKILQCMNKGEIIFVNCIVNLRFIKSTIAAGLSAARAVGIHHFAKFRQDCEYSYQNGKSFMHTFVLIAT